MLLIIFYCEFIRISCTQHTRGFFPGLDQHRFAGFHGYYGFVVIAQNMITGTDNFPLMAIPFFILAGELMNKGGLSLSLVRFVKSLLGHVRGGLGYVSVVAAILFAGVSGSAVADTSAVGSVLLPIMEKEGYKKDKSTALICAAGCIGPIIPPSIPMILFGVVGGVSIVKMFLGGFIPGVITGIILMITWHFMIRKDNLPSFKRASFKEILPATREAAPSLMLPVIIMGGILSGVFTPTEAAVVAVVYAFFIAVVIRRSLSLVQIKDVFVKSARATSVVMFVCAAATAIGYIITIARIPQMLGDLIGALTTSRHVVLLLINILLLIVGCFMDLTPALLILGPILLPVAVKFGIDPVFFGVIFVYALCIGLITPPVGTVLYVGCGISKISLLDLVKQR